MITVKKPKRAKRRLKQLISVPQPRTPPGRTIARFINNACGEMLRSYIVFGVGYDGIEVTIRNIQQPSDVASIGVMAGVASEDMFGGAEDE